MFCSSGKNGDGGGKKSGWCGSRLGRVGLGKEKKMTQNSRNFTELHYHLFPSRAGQEGDARKSRFGVKAEPEVVLVE